MQGPLVDVFGWENISPKVRECILRARGDLFYGTASEAADKQVKESTANPKAKQPNCGHSPSVTLWAGPSL